METEGAISVQEQKLILKLRELVQHELSRAFLSKSEEDQALYLIRWLRARDNNVDAAASMLLNHLQWRIERNADFAAGKLLHPFFTENYRYKFSGLDRKGNLIVLLPLSQWDFRKLLNNDVRLLEFDDFVTKFFETIMVKLRREDLLRKGTGKSIATQVTFIIDVKDYPYAQLVRVEAIKRILHMMSIYEAHYPEILYRGIYINCPTYFGIFVNMLKHVLSARTHSKIKYYSHSQLGKWKTEMVEFLDPAIIPEQYGGILKNS